MPSSFKFAPTVNATTTISSGRLLLFSRGGCRLDLVRSRAVLMLSLSTSVRVLESLDRIASWADDNVTRLGAAGATSMLAVAHRLGLYKRAQPVGSVEEQDVCDAAHLEFSSLWAAFNPMPLEDGRRVERLVHDPSSSTGRIHGGSGTGRSASTLVASIRSVTLLSLLAALPQVTTLSLEQGATRWPAVCTLTSRQDESLANAGSGISASSVCTFAPFYENLLWPAPRFRVVTSRVTARMPSPTRSALVCHVVCPLFLALGLHCGVALFLVHVPVLLHDTWDCLAVLLSCRRTGVGPHGLLPGPCDWHPRSAWA